MAARRNLLVKCLLSSSLGGGAWGGYLFGNGIYESFKEKRRRGVEGLGIPGRCRIFNSPCELTEEELGEIKFEGLGDAGEVEVKGFGEARRITLTIRPEENQNKYIFSNVGDGEIEIRRGSESNSVILSGNTETVFVRNGEKLRMVVLGSFGLPEECREMQGVNPTVCSLGEYDLGKIKFGELENAVGEMEVSNYPRGKTISLRIDNGGSTKKYIFLNDSGSEISLRKSSVSLVLGNGKTRFGEDGGNLRKLVLGDFGLPENCGSGCQLTEDDLEQIGFRDLGDGERRISNFPEGKTIDLRVEGSDELGNKKYIFSNGSSGEIEIGGDSGVLKLKEGETKFYEEGGELKKLELDGLGLPPNCTLGVKCNLTENDLEDIGFSSLGEEGETEVLNLPSGQSISLEIKKAIGTERKKYIFSNGFKGDVEIRRGDKTVVLSGKGTKFTEENGKLREVELGDYGLPRNCGSGCTLEVDDLEDVEFSGMEVGEEATISSSSINKLILKIENDGNGERRYIFDNSGGKIDVKRGSRTVTLRGNGKTRFTVENGKLKELETGDFGLPGNCGSGCQLIADDLEQVRFKVLGENTDKVTVSGLDSGQKIQLKIDSTVQSGSRYIFTNGSTKDVKISSASGGSVTLGGGKTKFIGEGDGLNELELDELGFPSTCKGQCTLSGGDLEDIKFQALVGGGEVTVDDYPADQPIALETVEDGANRRYIFLNGSSKPTVIRRASSSVTLRGNGKTRFTVENGKLKELETGDFGLPKDCKGQCTLTKDDLEQVRFKILGEGEYTVSNLPSGQVVSLRVEGSRVKRYVFDNGSGGSITISSKGSDSVVLEGGKTKFIGEGNKLKKLELGDYGQPKNCRSQCSLSADDLGEIKFQELGEDDGEVVVVDPTSQTISLRIEDGYRNNGRKYIFTNGSGSEVNIRRGSRRVTLGEGKTRFIEENNKLKKVEINGYGLPSHCTESCSLTSTDLEDINFEELKEQTGKVRVSPGDKTVVLRVSGSGKNKYSFFNGSSSPINIIGGDKTMVLGAGERTKFIGEGNKLKKLILWDYGLPKSCENKETCSLTTDDLEDIRFEDLGEEGDGEIIITPTNVSNQEFTLKKENGGYILESGKQETKIKRGSKEVVIGGWRKIKLTVNGDKLKGHKSWIIS